MQSPLTTWLVGIFLVALALGSTFTILSMREPQQKLPPPAPVVQGPVQKVLGKSVQGRDIVAYTYGTGSTKLVFLGGIHGGYEWNATLLAQQFKEYLDARPDAVPQNLSVTVIPNLNPDSMYATVGKEGRFTEAEIPKDDLSEKRFNANGVDLNRNFDCSWAPTGTWRNKTVSGGTEAFSEPESKALRDYALAERPAAMIFWHSQAGAVYASNCNGSILPTTLAVMNIYAKAAGYDAVKEFTAYEVHGASEDWLASIGIPAITVELTTHDSPEWNKNLAGIQALLQYFSSLKI
jgi:predicted deacylase